MDDESLRKTLGAVLGPVFWGIVLAIWPRREKPPGYYVRRSQETRYKAYLFGCQVRRLWDRCIHGRRSSLTPLKRIQDRSDDR